MNMNRALGIVKAFISVVFLWYLASLALWLKNTGSLILLPMPHVVLLDLWTLLLHEHYYKDIFASVVRILLGVSLAVIPAFILGFVFGSKPKLNNVAEPMFAFAKYIPPVSFVPILILWLGIGLSQQLALLFIGVFFYLTMMTAETVGGTPKALLNAGQTMGLTGFRLVSRIVFPFALPRLIEHVRTMFGIAWTYLVVVEMVAAPDGIGRVIINSQRFLQTERVLAGMLTIGLLGILFDLGLIGISQVICRWERLNVKH